MARLAEVSEAAHGAPAEAAPSAPVTVDTRPEVDRGLGGGERWVARLLRAGALTSGALFLASLGLELLPETELQQAARGGLRKAAALVLLATPVLRLAAAGVVLGLRGEWRYAVCAAGVLALLALAVLAGLSA